MTNSSTVISAVVKKANTKHSPKPICCLECAKLVVPTLRVGKVLEPDNEEVKRSRFLQCPTCKNYVGTTSSKTKKGNTVYSALGSIPTKDVASARSTVHAAIVRVTSKLDVSKNRIAKKLATTDSHVFRISSIDSTEQAISVLKRLQEVENELKVEIGSALPKEVAEARRRVLDTISNTCETLNIEALEAHKALSAGGSDFKIEDINTLEDAKVVITKLRAYRKEVKAQSTKTA